MESAPWSRRGSNRRGEELASRLQTLTVVVYFTAASLLVAMTAGSLVLVEESERLRLVSRLSPWIPGLIWLPSGVLAAVVAYRLRAVGLALSVAGSFLLTSVLLYVWANAVAFVGGGAWDQLRGITGGGLYPIVAVSVFVVAGGILTLVRGDSEQRG